MRAYTLTDVDDHELVSHLKSLVVKDRGTTAEILAHIAEVDSRRLYLPAAHPSMFSYCQKELGFSEEMAFKRIRAARMARKYPVIFAAIADGRLHVSAVVLLSKYLRRDNADELLRAAFHKSKSEIVELLAERFPQADVPTLVRAIPSPSNSGDQLSPGTVPSPSFGRVIPSTVELGAPESAAASVMPLQHAPGADVSTQLSPGTVAPPRARVEPLAPERYALQTTIRKDTRDKLRRIQELLGHQIARGDVAEVIDRAFDLLLANLEKQKFAATSRPRPVSKRESKNPRHIPAHVKRSVWERDQGQCSYVSDGGHRCPERSRLEFDHADPVARGGEASVETIRLRCRAPTSTSPSACLGPSS
jgi:hypothetical protein